MTEPPNQGPDYSKPQQPGYGPPNPQGPGTPDPYGSTQYGQTPPPQQPPSYGQQPPSYGQQPPSYGQQPPGYGQQPPSYGQQSGYGAPESGAPAGGYGAVPPGTTPPQYGAPGAGVPGAGVPGAPQQVNIGEALSWAWAQFKANPGPMIVPGLIMFLIGGVIAAVYFAILAVSSTTTTYDNAYGGTYQVTTSSVGAGGLLLGIVLYVVVFVAIMYLSASMITGALRVADGQPVSVATFLKPDRFGPVVGTAIVVGLITAVGLVLCIIPGLIAIFLLQFSIFFVIDKKLGLGAAMSASTNLSRSSVSNSLLTLVVAYVLSYIGTILCYIGLIVTWPLGQLFYAHCYRRLTGGYVAPAPV